MSPRAPRRSRRSSPARSRPCSINPSSCCTSSSTSTTTHGSCNYRPTALFRCGNVHTRYRDAINDSLALIEPHILRAEVARVAQRLIGEFAATGSGDPIAQYARRLPVHVFVTWFGVPPGDSERIVNGIAGMFNSAEDAATAYADLVEVVTELVADRRARPRRDLTSYLLAHPADLDHDETVRQITLITCAGHDPTTDPIGNALLHMLTDARYAGSPHGGAMTAHEAIDEVLRQDPPPANLSAHYPRNDMEFHGVRLRAGQLLLVSCAAANTQSPPGLSDPGIRSGAVPIRPGRPVRTGARRNIRRCSSR
ncbi:hypothetical protein [Streptomyces sp. NPDC058092]|uniref:hypothetical protein n=1 Tax=Streptomyces sp. NPDC058092 TaxID=3346336 RepID=UPI0036E933C6